MTQTQTKHDGTGRRTFIKGVATLPVAAAGIGAMSAPASATDWDDVFWAGEGGDSSAARYIVDRVSGHFSDVTGDYENKQSQSGYYTARESAISMRASNDQVLTAIQNLAENAKSVAYQQARAAVLKALNDDAILEDAQEKGEKAVYEYIEPSQKNLADRFSQMAIECDLINEKAEELDFARIEIGGSDTEFSDLYVSRADEEVELLSGKKYEYDRLSGGQHAFVVDRDYERHLKLNGDFDEDNEYITREHKKNRFGVVWKALEDAGNEAIDEIDEFVDAVAPEYAAGELDTDDITTPQDLWDMSSDDAENPYATADLAGLGLEVNRDSAVIIDLLDDGETIEGEIYASDSPMGESIQTGIVYDPTADRETENGEPVDEIDDYDGTEEDPVPLDGLVYFAAVVENESRYGQLDQLFEVTGAFDDDGEEIESIGFEPSTGQQTNTTDIDEIREELEATNEEVLRIEEERNELATGGGAGLGGDGGTLAAAAAAGAAIFYLFGSN